MVATSCLPNQIELRQVDDPVTAPAQNRFEHDRITNYLEIERQFATARAKMEGLKSEISKSDDVYRQLDDRG